MNTTPVEKQKRKVITKEDINSMITYSAVMNKRRQMLERLEQRNALEALRETKGVKK